jgi:hypothetical protein
MKMYAMVRVATASKNQSNNGGDRIAIITLATHFLPTNTRKSSTFGVK